MGTRIPLAFAAAARYAKPSPGFPPHTVAVTPRETLHGQEPSRMSRLLRRGRRPSAVPDLHRRRRRRGRRRRPAAVRHGQGLGRPDAEQRRRKRPSRPSTTCSPTTRRKVICFDWDYKDDENGLLRTHVSNNWQITKPNILSDFYTKKQQDVIHDIWKGHHQPRMVRPLRQAAQGRHRRRRVGRAAEHRHLRQAGRRRSSSSS